MTLDNPRIMFIFPGQGAQYRGMGSDLYQHYATFRSVYDRAGEVLGYDIADLSFNNPDDQLNLTRFTQPALLTHSIACLEVFRELTDHRVTPIMAAGHSLGEYCALVAAGALNFEAALALVQKRGEFMGTYGKGEMLAFPLDLETIKPLAERHFCAVAGCNLRDQTVVGGSSEDLDRLSQEAQERFPRKRAVRLKTEGAFHTYYMVDAARHYRSVLDAAVIDAPSIGVLSNYTGKFHDADPAAIKSCLFFQLFHPVLWYFNMQTALEQGIHRIIEFGGGIGGDDTPESKRPNLEGMIKKIQRGTDYKADYYPVINAQTLENTLKIL